MNPNTPIRPGRLARKKAASRGAPKARAPIGTDGTKLSDYLSPDAIIDHATGTKDEILRALASLVAGRCETDTIVEKIYQGIQVREAAVNTYVGNGVAIPHARVDCVDGIALALARNPEGMPYGIDTDEPVVLSILVVVNESLGDEYLRILSMIANAIKDRRVRDAILQAPDAATIVKILDAPGGERERKKARPLTQLLLSHAQKIAREMGATAILVSLESTQELTLLKRIKRRKNVIVATGSPLIAKRAEDVVERILLLPRVPLPRDSRVRLSALMALARGLIKKGDVVAFLSGNDPGALDTMTILEIGRSFGRFIGSTGLEADGIQPGVLERIITIATELGAEGREGKAVGALFVVLGEPEKLEPVTQQMVINPFRGYPEEERNMLDPMLAETVKEFAALDGAFIIRGDGVLISAGTFLRVEQVPDLPGGLGSRHRVACAITKSVNCLALCLSQSTGTVTIYKNGDTVLSLPRSER